mgnify:CR=1 FL=1
MKTLSRNPRLGGVLALVGSVLLVVSGLLSWSYEPILGDISVRFWPVTLQVYAMVIGVVALVLAGVAVTAWQRDRERYSDAELQSAAADRVAVLDRHRERLEHLTARHHAVCGHGHAVSLLHHLL